MNRRHPHPPPPGGGPFLPAPLVTLVTLAALFVMMMGPDRTRAEGISDAGLRAPAGAASDASAPEAGRPSPQAGLTGEDAGAWLEGKSLRVGCAGSKPFVDALGPEPTGLSVSVWNAVADELDLRTRFVRYASVSALLRAVAKGEVQVGIGPLSVTAQRASLVDFTQPYFSARVGILSKPHSSAWERLRPFANRAFLIGVLTLVLVLVAVGTLVWFVERGKNPQHFPVSPHRGIAEGMWFALVTMTTVGYGDRAPVTVSGRIIAGIWMIFAMVAASSITAGIATALTLSQIDAGGIHGLDDLAHQRVLVVRGTPGEQVAREYGARRFTVADKNAGIARLRKGDADAMLYDLPILDHLVQQSEGHDLVAYGTPVHADDYAFVVARGSNLYRPLNRVLLELRETRAIAEIASDWLVQD